MNRRDNPGPTQSSTNWVLVAIVVAVALLIVTAMIRRPGNLATHPAVGNLSPELDLLSLFATAVEPATQGKATLTGLPPAGVVTVLHFWGTWCPPCRLEYPHLVEMVKARKANPQFQFVTVSCEAGDEETLDEIRATTSAYYDQIQAGPLTTYVDPAGATRVATANAIGAKSMVYPTTIVVDANQRIAGVWLGYSPASLVAMEQLVDDLLSDAS